MKRVLLGAVAAAMVSATLGAAPRTADAPATIVLNVPVTATSRTDGAIFPKLGDSVTFGVSFPRSAQKYDPRIQVLCYQNGDLVYGEAGPYYQEFLLGGAMSLWFLGDGAASCHADLYYWSYQGSQKFNLLASTEFDAAGR